MELPQVFPHARSRRRFGHFAGIFLPVLILFILCFGSVLYVDYARLRERMESDQSELVSLTVVAFQNFYSSINSDLDGLARELAITRLVNGDDTAIPEIEFLFTNFAERRQIFDQVRLIGANGQETVRINFRDGVTEVVAEPDLQNQSDRYYFSATMEAAPNQLYVSDFDLNVESGIIETPIRPVVRLGIPLQRDDGSRWGILILNLNGTALINSIRNVAENNNSEIWLLNQDGYFLVGPNQEDEWAFMFPDRADRTLAQQNPALWNKLRGEPTIGFDHEGDWYTRYPFCGDLSCRFSYQLQQDPSASIDLDLPSAAHFLVSRISAENLGFAVVLAPNFSQWTPLGGLLFALVSAVGAISWQFARSFDRIRIRDDQLIQQQALLDGFVTHNPNAMFVHDLQGNYLLANEALRDLAGIRDQQVLGHKRRDVLPEPMVPIFEAQEQLVIASKKAKEFVSNVSLSDRDRHLRIFRFPILDGMGAVSAVGGIAIDVTDAVITQQELNEQRNSLEIAVTERTKELELEKIRAEEANNAKSAFLATMSHEIRTPMNGVMGMVEVLRLSELKPRQQEQVELIRDSAKSLLSVIDDILDFSKIEAGKILLEREPVVLSYLFESSCASLAALARQRRVDFEYYRSLKLPASIVSDSVRLRQIIHNVGGNALKFSSGTPRHGKVAIRFEAPDKESLRIIVRDNGIGMNTEQVDHLFTAFQQADVTTTRRFGGTGLGMAITYRLVQLLNGYITVQSEPDVGTTISITLPIQSVSEHTSPEFTYHGDLKKIHVHTTVAERMENWIEYFQAIEMPVAPIANLDQLNDAFSDLPAGEESALLIDSEDDSKELIARVAGQASHHPETTIILTELAHSNVENVVNGFILLNRSISQSKNFRRVLGILSGIDLNEQDPKGSLLVSPSLERDEAIEEGRFILVVEDNEINQQVIRNQLELLGFACDIAANGQEGLSLWSEFSSQYNLILTDIHMPIMDGYDLVNSIRQQETRDHRIPIIALTANATKGEKEKCISSGMDDYLAKPVELETLKLTLESWIENGKTTTPGKAVNKQQSTCIEWDVVRRYLGSDRQLIGKFIKNYRAAASKIGGSIKTDFESKNWDSLMEKAHTFKSSSRTVGALQLGELCATLESACESRNIELIGKTIQEFRRELDEVLDMLNKPNPISD